MNTTPEDIKDVMVILSEALQRISTISRGCDDERLQSKPGEDEWSVNEILAHLRACADVWGGMIQKMLTQDHPTFRYLSPRTYIRRTDYPVLSFTENLAALIGQREELLGGLRALEPADWSRGATVKQGDKLREHTVYSTTRRMALHELDHCAQIEALIRDFV